MRLALTIAAVVLGLTVVLAVTFYEPKAPDTGTDAEQEARQADADEGEQADEGVEADPGRVADAGDSDTGTDESDAEPDNAADSPAETDPPDDDATADAADANAEDADAEAPEAAPAATLHARFVEEDGTAITPIEIGSIEDGSAYKLRATISPYRAGVLEVRLADYFELVDQVEHHTLLKPIAEADDDNHRPAIGSYAARYIIIDGGDPIALFRQDAQGHWIGGWEVIDHNASSVTLRLVIESHLGEVRTPIAEVTRIYRLAEDAYTLQLEQSVKNLTDDPMRVQWEQYAQGDVTWDSGDYLRGRSRQYVLGYFNLKHDPGRFSISSRYLPRDSLVNEMTSDKNPWPSVWPNPDVDLDPAKAELAWLASVNRYFTVVTSSHVDPNATDSSGVVGLEAIYPEIGTILSPSAASDPDAKANDRAVMFTLRSQTLTVGAGKSTDPADLGLDIFTGPRKKQVFSEGAYAPMRLGQLVRYSLGGMCGFCTFQWLADGLMGLLQLFHTVLFDWGVAIILLVLIVRLCLHPITKRGQTSMMKMGKQMAAIQPEVAKLKKKYADNPQKMQQEQMKLFREKGINPAAGAMGCLPMLLQMPIWIALYAMLYYAIELRHEPAFYGFFQLFGDWQFLADLSRSDHFITFFKEPKTFSLLFITFDYSGINILPLLMAVTFYINMKFTTPPPANEQQAQQQKIMRIMPFLFPIMLYSAPSGLTLYICASTAAGIIDSYIVRKHVKELEESGKLFEKKERKPGGLMHRIQMAAEKAQQAQQERDKPGGGGDKNRGPQNFKKRKR
ncbi:membrane protein insertase YidC [Phycisphaeraceae bacterium D3-23]